MQSYNLVFFKVFVYLFVYYATPYIGHIECMV